MNDESMCMFSVVKIFVRIMLNNLKLLFYLIIIYDKFLDLLVMVLYKYYVFFWVCY